MPRSPCNDIQVISERLYITVYPKTDLPFFLWKYKDNCTQKECAVPMNFSLWIPNSVFVIISNCCSEWGLSRNNILLIMLVHTPSFSIYDTDARQWYSPEYKSRSLFSKRLHNDARLPSVLSRPAYPSNI